MGYHAGVAINCGGFLYGTTGGGYPSILDYGTVFSYSTETGRERVLYRFLRGGGRINPTGLVHQSGYLYGVTTEGGMFN